MLTIDDIVTILATEKNVASYLKALLREVKKNPHQLHTFLSQQNAEGKSFFFLVAQSGDSDLLQEVSSNMASQGIPLPQKLQALALHNPDETLHHLEKTIIKGGTSKSHIYNTLSQLVDMCSQSPQVKEKITQSIVTTTYPKETIFGQNESLGMTLGHIMITQKDQKLLQILQDFGKETFLQIIKRRVTHTGYNLLHFAARENFLFEELVKMLGKDIEKIYLEKINNQRGEPLFNVLHILALANPQHIPCFFEAIGPHNAKMISLVETPRTPVTYEVLLLKSFSEKISQAMHSRTLNQASLKSLIRLLVIIVNTPLNMASLYYEKLMLALKAVPYPPHNILFPFSHPSIRTSNLLGLMVLNYSPYAQELLAELRKINNPHFIFFLFEKKFESTWSIFETALMLSRLAVLEHIFGLAKDNKHKMQNILLTRSQGISLREPPTTTLLLAANSEEAFSFTSTILAILEGKAFHLAQCTNIKGKTFLHLLAERNLPELIPCLRVLKKEAKNICLTKDKNGKNVYDTLMSTFSSPHPDIQLEILIVTDQFDKIFSTETLGKAIQIYLNHYGDITHPKLIIMTLDKIGRLQTAFANDAHRKNFLAAITAIWPNPNIHLAVLSFLLDPRYDLVEKNIVGIEALIPFLFNHNPQEQQIIAVLEDRQARHDSLTRQIFTAKSVDPQRGVNQLFEKLTQILMQDPHTHKIAFAHLHPCGIAYRLIEERIQPHSGYNGQQVIQWFAALLSAKINADQRTMTTLLQSHHRPQKMRLFTLYDSTEPYFKKVMERLCATEETHLKQFLHQLAADGSLLSQTLLPLLPSWHDPDVFTCASRTIGDPHL